MAFLIGGSNSAADTGYDVANSCRFDGSSAYMHKTPGSTGNVYTATFSAWIKRGSNLAAQQELWTSFPGTEITHLLFSATTGTLHFQAYSSSSATTNVETTRRFNDPGAWYHIVVAMDTTESTAANRVKIFVNGGSAETALEQNTYESEDGTLSFNTSGRPFYLGTYPTPENFFNGYMAEVCWIDGTAYAPSDFGEFDEDSPTIWKPKDVSGLTFGTNGFYLDFEDSSNLGNDVNGGTDLTEVNLAAVDQATDSPTNNFCTMNPLDNFYAASVFSEGNCRVVTDSTSQTWNTSTFGLSAGKWYCEITIIDEGSNGGVLVGITDRPSESASTELGELATSYAYLSSGQFRTNNGNTANSVAATDGDIIGIALNLDDNEISYYKNNVLIVAAQSITAPASTENGVYFIASSDYLDNDTTTNDHNFGNPVVAHSSAANDASGYGSFEYAPPSGFLAICTKNLATYG